LTETGKGKSIRNVSDTARWVAFYRAMESERHDALFRDPYARKLAGERGEQIVKALRQGKRQSWSMVVRTALMDEILLRVIATEKIDSVVNLAAGLDTRPFRLNLPDSMQWTEVDLPEMIEYKTEMLAGETPKCRLERISLDLSNPETRRELFQRLNSSAARVFVITEGLLAYLTEEQVAGLAKDLHDVSHFQFWITDIASPKVKKVMDKQWGKELRAAGAPIQFAPASAEEFFRPYGWESVEFRGFYEASRELNRRMPGDWMIRFWARLMPARTARMMKQWRSGVTLLRRI